MQISAVNSNQNVSFKGAQTTQKPELQGVIRFDEGQPYLAVPLKQDVFERSAKAEENEPKTVSEAIQQGKPGFRHEDFLY